MIRFRLARREDVPAIVALLAEDSMGTAEVRDDLAPYYTAFDRMAAEDGNTLIVGEEAGRVIATYQLTFISGLSLGANRRAQIESVRVASECRGRGIGAAMIVDAEARARAEGCDLMQLTSNTRRDRARKFYEEQGFTASHTGFKRALS